MGIRIPNLAVLLAALGVGILAVCLKNMAVAAICFAIAAIYAAALAWQWRRQRKDK